MLGREGHSARSSRPLKIEALGLELGIEAQAMSPRGHEPLGAQVVTTCRGFLRCEPLALPAAHFYAVCQTCHVDLDVQVLCGAVMTGTAS